MGWKVDFELLDIIMATVAANRMREEPIWLMIVGPSGSGKTTIAQSLAGLGEYVEIVSSLSSEAAFLSGAKPTDKKFEDSATGGILKKLGNHGLMVFKDFTSVLSMHPNTKPGILAALREIHDGNWARKIGGEGGRELVWKGHMGVIGCCTEAWDRAYGTIAAMGDRFTVIRPADTEDVRAAAIAQACQNIGQRKEMTYDLRQAASNLLRPTGPHMKVQPLFPGVTTALAEAASLAARARAVVDHNYRGQAEFAYSPELPARFIGGLLQLIQGGLHLGMSTDHVFNLAMRCVRDSIPPMRLRVLEFLFMYRNSTVAAVHNNLEIPWNAADRAVSDLFALGMLHMERSENERSPRFYSVKPSINLPILWTRAQLVDPAPQEAPDPK